MGFSIFKNLFKEKVVKEVYGGAWGHLAGDHHIDVDTLCLLRCVDRPGTVNGGEVVTLLRIFRPTDVEKQGILVTGWETFDQHPDLILFEGYLTEKNRAHLERKNN